MKHSEHDPTTGLPDADRASDVDVPGGASEGLEEKAAGGGADDMPPEEEDVGSEGG